MQSDDPRRQNTEKSIGAPNPLILRPSPPPPPILKLASLIYRLRYLCELKEADGVAETEVKSKMEKMLLSSPKGRRNDSRVSFFGAWRRIVPLVLSLIEPQKREGVRIRVCVCLYIRSCRCVSRFFKISSPRPYLYRMGWVGVGEERECFRPDLCK